MQRIPNVLLYAIRENSEPLFFDVPRNRERRLYILILQSERSDSVKGSARPNRELQWIYSSMFTRVRCVMPTSHGDSLSVVDGLEEIDDTKCQECNGTSESDYQMLDEFQHDGSTVSYQHAY